MTNIPIEELYHDVYHVLFTYYDGSQMIMRTTLNDKLLEGVLSKRKENQLFDLDKKRWINIPSPTDASLQIFKQKPEVEPIYEHINRYI